MENGETTAQAAMRETDEEAGANIIIDAPFALISIAHINQVHLFIAGA
jgi:8-oxo-dGTP pyrophosphatase MutT (NUDIX family)